MDERFQASGALAEELGRWERGEPILSRPISVFAYAPRWAAKTPLVVVRTGLAFVAFHEQHRTEAQLCQITMAEAVPNLITYLETFHDDAVPKLWEQLEVGNATVDQTNRLRMALIVLDRKPLWKKSADRPEQSGHRHGCSAVQVSDSSRDAGLAQETPAGRSVGPCHRHDRNPEQTFSGGRCAGCL